MILAGIGFVGLATHLVRMLPGAAPSDVAQGDREWWVLAPLAASMAVMVVLGLLLPGPVGRLLGRIVEAMTT
jgi:hypothetical protein